MNVPSGPRACSAAVFRHACHPYKYLRIAMAHGGIRLGFVSTSGKERVGGSRVLAQSRTRIVSATRLEMVPAARSSPLGEDRTVCGSRQIFSRWRNRNVDCAAQFVS